MSFLKRTEGSNPLHRPPTIAFYRQNLSQATKPGVTRMLMTNKLLCSNKATAPRVTSNLLQIFN